MTHTDLPSDIGLLEGQKLPMPHMTEDAKKSQTSEIFQWWLGNNDVVRSELLHFEQCCARELAYCAIDIKKPFTFFPLAQTVMGQYSNAPNAHSALMDIERVYKEGNGCGVIIQNMSDNIPGQMKDIVPCNHVCDVIVMKPKSRPSVISVLSNDCNKAEASSTPEL